MTTYYVDTAVGNNANAGTSEGSGNAWATLQKAFDTAVAGDLVYIKGSGTYSEQVDVDTNSGTATSPIIFEGYTSTPGDGGQITWDGTTYCVNCNGTPDYIRFRNILFTGCTSYCLNFITATAQNWRFHNCSFTASATVLGGTNDPSYISFRYCKISGMSSHGLSARWNGLMLYRCKIIDNGNNGVSESGYSQGMSIIRCIIAGNTGDAVNIGNSTEYIDILNCTIEGNGGDGLDLAGSNLKTVNIFGNIIANHTAVGAVGLKLATPTGSTLVSADCNVYYNNTTNRSGSDSTGPNDVVLSADPFTNAGSDDWTLNNTAGGGADVRAGLTYDFDGTNIDYLDGGAVQHQDAGGGGGGGTVYPIIIGG